MREIKRLCLFTLYYIAFLLIVPIHLSRIEFDFGVRIFRKCFSVFVVITGLSLF